MNRLSTCMSKLSLGCPGLRISYYNDGISYLDDNLFSLLFLFSSVSSAYSLSSRSNLFIRYSFFFCFFSCSAILNLSFSSFSTFDLYYLSSSYFSNLSFSSYSAFILCCFYYSCLLLASVHPQTGILGLIQGLHRQMAYQIAPLEGLAPHFLRSPKTRNTD